MHSQLALMELPSLNLAPFLLLNPVGKGRYKNQLHILGLFSTWACLKNCEGVKYPKNVSDII